MKAILRWFERNFTNPQVLILAALLLVGLGLVVFLGDILGPVLAAVVLAYLLEGVVRRVVEAGLGRPVAAPAVFAVFMVVGIAVLFGLVPMLSRQLTQLVGQLPAMFANGQDWLMHLPARYPEIFTEAQVIDIIDRVREEIAGLGQTVVSLSLASVVNLIAFMVYLILVPLMVFFFLKDKHQILDWMTRYLPENRALAQRVWRDVDAQIGNYIRGKFWEILIIWFATYLLLTFVGLQFAMLLSLLVGLSVIIPYIGATVVTLPIFAVGVFQFGWTTELAQLMIGYGIIQFLDGNLLVPLLFSEVVNLHPIAIIVAILFFGGIWGFWGVFFAIPLATLVKAVLHAWPDEEHADDLEAEAGP
ncbi:MAG: AI-2E family transporter [Gammaproteobacteria bacterium]|nr:AI-2E family transporter [Gammaproteobacteria bacterium]